MKKVFALLTAAGSLAVVSCGEGNKPAAVQIDTVVTQDIMITDSTVVDVITVEIDTVAVPAK